MIENHQKICRLCECVESAEVGGVVYRLSYTDKKENYIFLIYKEIQTGAVAKSYMRKV
jgi:hypothetical protein